MKLRPGFLHRSGGGITPTFVGTGTVGSTGSTFFPILPTYPAGVEANDIALLLLENYAADGAVSPGSGYANVTGSPITDGATGTRLHVFWKRLDGTEDSGESIVNFGNHLIGIILAFRRCKQSGDPWNTVNTGSAGAAGTSLSFPTVTTTAANCMIVNIVSTGADVASTTEFSAFANAGLASITEAVDTVTSGGNGGGLGASYGIKTAAGAVAATTATAATSDRHAYMTLALQVGT